MNDTGGAGPSSAPARHAGDPGPEASPAARFRAFARRHHPDVGGDPDTFRRGVAAFRAGRSPFEVLPAPAGADGRIPPTWDLPDDDPRLDAPIVAVSGHLVPRTVRAGRRWLGRAPLSPVRQRRVV